MPDPDFYSLLRALAESHVDYVLIGGFALVLNGGGVLTADVDLCVSLRQDNLQALAEALNQFEPRLRSGTNVRLDERAFGGEFVTYYTSAGVVQFINRVNGFSSFEDLRRESQIMSVKGVEVRVANLAALEKMKTGTGRNRDQIHLEIIHALQKKADS